jgi:phenylalanyl-tRNA synthetase beta chain
MKGVLETMLAKYHLVDKNWETGHHTLLDTTHTQRILSKDKPLGIMGRVKPALCAEWDINDDVFVFEIDVAILLERVPRSVIYKPVSRFPGVKRDLSIVINEEIPVDEIHRAIQASGGETLTSVQLFDLYRGDQITENQKSAAFSLVFSSPSRTLKEEEVDPIVSNILKTLEKNFSAELRS